MAVADSATGTASHVERGAAVLEMHGVEKNFGGLQAVAGCSFGVAASTITGLIGPNGAGKTTLFNLITGQLQPDAGDIRYRGERIAHLPPDDIARRGLVRTFQIPRSFDRMTVWENLMFAAPRQAGERLLLALLRPPQARQQEAAYSERAWEILAFLGLDHLAESYAGALSGGQRKLLELARVLMMEPDTILLDEPAAGVNPALMERLAHRIVTLNRQGITFLIVEHDMGFIFRICHRIVVMHHGMVLAEGEPEAIRQDPQVLEAYLGG